MNEDKRSKKKQDEDALAPQQELFCQLYASHREFFGNGTQAYIEAYDVPPKGYKSAMSAASRLLSNVKITKRINEIFEAGGLNDTFVDKQLEFMITQFSDYKAKIAAIKEYNALKKRIEQKVDVTVGISLASLYDATKSNQQA